jgi:hypothetical protein
MRYTVWSRGRLIGETDLGFVPLIPALRSGSFHPNTEGERLMPVVAAVSPVMRAYLHRNATDASGGGFVLPELRGSTLFADLAESFHHVEALELELRREDGSVVPTACIGIQDTHWLLELAEQEEAITEQGSLEEFLVEGIEDFERLDVDASVGDQPPDALLEDWTEDWTDDVHEAWEPEKPIEFPRYQIHVELLHGDAIP